MLAEERAEFEPRNEDGIIFCSVLLVSAARWYIQAAAVV